MVASFKIKNSLKRRIACSAAVFFQSVIFSVALAGQTPSGINYPVASCVGGSCPSPTTVATQITAAYFDTTNETVYIGGKFDDLSGNSRNGLAAIDAANGNLLAWSPVVNNGVVTAIAKSGDTVFVGGTFTQINSQTRNRIAAISATTGNLFSTFSVGTGNVNDTVMSLLALGGKLYVGGKFSMIASGARNNCARLSLSGTLDAWQPAPGVTGAVRELKWYNGNIVALWSDLTASDSRIATISILSGSLVIRAQTDPGEVITDFALRGNIAFLTGPFITINGQTRQYTAACNLSNGTLTTWNPIPPVFSFDTRSKFHIGYFRDSLFIGVFDISNLSPTYHNIYVSHYTTGNLRVLKTYQSNLNGLNGYYNDNLLVGNALLFEVERFAQHTAFPNGSLNCNFYSYCLKPAILPATFMTGPANVCPGTSGVTYALHPLADFTSYIWTSNNPDVIINGDSSSVQVDFSESFSGSAVIFARGVTSCGILSPSSRSITVNALPVPGASAGNDDTLNCIVQQLELHGSSVTSGATFSWNGPSGNSATDSILVSQPGVYVLTVTAPNGCHKYDTAVVTLDTLRPALVSFTNIPQLTCHDTVVFLDASSYYPSDSLYWSGPGLQSHDNPAAVNQQGNFQLVITSRVNGCANSDTLFVAQNISPPPATIVAPDTVLTCSLSSIQLNATSPDSNVIFQWSDSNSNYFADPCTVIVPGFYLLHATDTTTGCTNSADLIYISSWTTAPGINALPDSVFLNCSHDTLNVNATSSTSGTTFSWTGPSGYVSNDSAALTQTGYYIVTATNPQNGCSSADSIYCGFRMTLDVHAGNDTTICPGSNATLSVQVDGGIPAFNYSWNNNAGNNAATTVYPADTTMYIVHVNDAAGCAGSDTVFVNVPSLLNDSVHSFQPCDPLQPTGELDIFPYGGISPYRFSIDNGNSWQNSGSFSNLNYGNYSILIEDSLGCSKNETVTIDTNSLSPQPDFLVSTNPQQGDTIVFVDISLPRPDSVSWDFPPAFVVYDSALFSPAVICNDTGSFNVTMHAFYRDCEIVDTRWINLHAFSSNNATPWNNNGIDTLLLYPNPNNGVFTCSVALFAKQNFVILVYDASGHERTRVQVADADNWSGQIAVPGALPGNYVLRVIAEFDSTERTFIIAQ